MSALKHYNQHGVMVAVESGSYGSGLPALAIATDGFHVVEAPDPVPEYQHGGEIEGRSTTGYATLANTNASGLAYAANLVHLFRGAGVAYSASVFPTIHTLMRLLGMSASVTTTPGSERWRYENISDAFPSGVAELYAAKEKYALKGLYAQSLEIAAPGPVVPRWTFGIRGIGTLPSDAAVPVITYPHITRRSPKASGIVFTLTSGAVFAGTIPEFTVRLARALEPLTKQTGTADEHGGFQPGVFSAEIDAVIRATPLHTSAPYLTTSLVSPYHLYDRGQAFELNLTVGTTQYNRWKVRGGTTQLSAAPTRRKVGEAMEWQVSMKVVPPTDGGVVDLQIDAD